ncbi:MAG: LysR family transcriptional regulator [Alphaproteobacteria bacterium]|nr:LysR family transcriptional regulator [Alphaproteobacteria bacterium]
MLDDLNLLRCFARIVALGSMSAAAKDLGVSLAVVSKRLRTLERNTRTRLINRTTRRLSPTDDGRKLYEHAERILAALAEAETHLASGADEPRGLLRVSAPISFGRVHLVPLAADLVQRYPHLDVELKLTDRVIDLVEERIDIAVRIGEPRDSSALFRKLVDNERVLVASPAYLKNFGRPRQPSDLHGHRFIRYDDSLTPWLLVGPNGRKVQAETPCRLRADSGDAVTDWALAGQGIAFKSDVDVVHELSKGRLERVLPEWRSPPTPVHALIAASQYVPLKVRTFIDALVAKLREGVAMQTKRKAAG